MSPRTVSVCPPHARGRGAGRGLASRKLLPGRGRGGRKGGGGVRPPGLWGGCRGPPEAGGGAGTRRHCGDEPATAPGGTGSSSARLGPGPARPGQRGLREPRAGPTRAWLQTLPSLHVSLGAASQLGADGRAPGLPGQKGHLLQGDSPEPPAHATWNTRASANPGWLDFDEDELGTSPYFQKWKTYGPLRSTSCRLGYWSRSGISVIFNIRVGVAWPQRRCPRCGLTIPHPGDSSPLPMQGTKPKSLAVPPFCQEK